MGKRYTPGAVKMSDPSLGSGTPRADSMRIPVSGSDFGAQNAQNLINFGRDLKGVAGNVASIYETISEPDKVSIQNDINVAERALLDIRTNAQTAQGMDSLKVVQLYRDEADKVLKTYADKYKDDARAFTMFNANVSVKHRGHEESLSQLQVSNVLKQRQLTLDTAINSSVDYAVANKNNPADIALSELEVATNTRAANKGFEKEVVDQRVQEAIHNLHMSIYNAHLVESPISAEDYLNSNKNKFDPSMWASIEKDLKPKALDEKANSVVDAWSAAGMPFDRQLAEAEKIKDADLRRETMRVAKDKEQNSQYIKRKAEQDYSDAEWTKLLNNPGQYKIPGTLPQETRRAMETWLSSLAREGKTNLAVYAEVMSLNEDAFLKEDLIKYLNTGEIVGPEFKQLVELQRSARNQDVNPDKQRIRTVLTQAKDAIFSNEDFYAKPGNDDTEQAIRRERFFRQVQTRTKYMTKEELSDEEKVGQVIDSLLKPGKGVKYKFEIPYSNNKGALSTENVPEAIQDMGESFYDAESNVRYIDKADGYRYLYDPVTGRLLGRCIPKREVFE